MKTQQVCQDFLRVHREAIREAGDIDAMEAARLINRNWGISVDWHEMAEALDTLRRFGEAYTTQPGGFCRYSFT